MGSANTYHDSKPTAWRDGRRWLWLASPAFPLIGLACLLLSPLSGIWLWVLPFLFYGVASALDWIFTEDRNNPPESAVGQLESDRYYRFIVAAYIPSQIVATVVGAYLAATAGWALWEWAGALVTVGMINGVAINTAHELGHKKNDWERWLSKFTLAPVAYGHFFVEHNRGHHKNVATPADPASSRMGESFWAFLPRTVIGSVKSAWGIEKDRLQRKGESVWSIHNDNLQAWAMTVGLYAVLTAAFGWWALLFLAVQAVYGASLLEVVNYLEHYGLLRKKQANGRYERCQPCHSWNSNHIFTNLFLYQLQRHSDHHANPTRRYQALRHFEESPQLPSGYTSMIFVAYIPWLWFAMMDQRVVAHHNGDLRGANLQPSKRAALLARYPVPADAADADAQGAYRGDQAAPAVQSCVQDGNAARHQCPNCNYVYDVRSGCPDEGYPPGTAWAELPDDWQCPDCAVRDKPDFTALADDRREAA